MLYTRRDLGRFALAAAASTRLLAAKPNSKFGGVQIGAITYSFRALPGSAEQILQYSVDCGISAVELMSAAAETYAGAPAPPARTPEAMKAWREAIDELETRKGARTFWKDRESDFMNYLKAFRSNQFEEYIVKALAGPDKGLHWWMREELSMVEVAKQPFAFAFTTAGGTAVDFANLRGKIVYLYFWSLESPGKKEDLDSVKELYGMNRKQFEVIGVACGTDEDRVKILEFIQSKRLKWPQSISGPVENLDVAKKLNVTAKKLPTGFVFDGGGILIDANLSPGNLKWSLEKYLARLK